MCFFIVCSCYKQTTFEGFAHSYNAQHTSSGRELNEKRLFEGWTVWKVAEWLELVASQDNLGTIPVFRMDEDALSSILVKISTTFNQHWAHHACTNPEGMLDVLF